ncbi:hypothetical protein ABID21_004553 [Pseudorhizobium tarimense]|uniref:Uncharacterized protein n=1 Tax=Pseudorhizobium tarimense TaxID=1079109 RepID=A0ABV2HCZ3_9HYPH
MLGDCGLEKGNGADGPFIREDVGEGDAGCVVDADMDVFPSDAARLALARPVAGDPVSDPLEAAETLDVEMDQAAWLSILVECTPFRRTCRLV